MFARTTMTPTDWHVSARKGGEGAPATLGFEGDIKHRRDTERRVRRALDNVAAPRSRKQTPIWRNGSFRMRERVEIDTIGTYLPQDLNFDLNGTVF